MRRELFFDHALLPSGWARDVRIAVDDGIIVAVAEGGPRDGADRVAGIAVPGFPICIAMRSSAAWPGLPSAAVRPPTASGPGAR